MAALDPAHLNDLAVRELGDDVISAIWVVWLAVHVEEAHLLSVRQQSARTSTPHLAPQERLLLWLLWRTLL